MIVLLLAGLLAACDRQSPPPEQAAAEGMATSGEAPSGGNDAEGAFNYELDRSKAGTPAPDFTFGDPDGGDTSLSEFSGRPLLVNLWATWCAPCVAEMPTLDAVAATYGPKGLAVLTISQDLESAGVKAFFEKHDLPHLKGWTDPDNRFGTHYATGLLPTSILYDAHGQEMVRVIGAMDWNSAEARALLDAAMKS
ncbi:MAG: TlpA disulfide reductase family protein [Sphingobium sp.]